MGYTLRVTLINQGNTPAQADELISEARKTLWEMLENDEDPSDLMMDLFGLEPDYLEDLF